MKTLLVFLLLATVLIAGAEAQTTPYDLSVWGSYWTVGPISYDSEQEELVVTWTAPALENSGWSLVYPPANRGSAYEFDVAERGSILVAKITAQGLPAHPSGTEWSIPWSLTFFVGASNSAVVTCADVGDPLVNNPAAGWQYNHLNPDGGTSGLREGTFYYVMDLADSESFYNSSWVELDGATEVSLWGLTFGAPLGGLATGVEGEPIIFTADQYLAALSNTVVRIGAVYIGDDPNWYLEGDEAVPVLAGASVADLITRPSGEEPDPDPDPFRVGGMPVPAAGLPGLMLLYSLLGGVAAFRAFRRFN